MLRTGALSTTTAGVGQSASTPAMIATTSSSVGVGETSLSDTALRETAASESEDVDVIVLGVGSDMEATGIYEFMGGDGIAVIEWAEHLPPDDVEGCVKVWINLVSETAREIIIEGDA